MARKKSKRVSTTHNPIVAKIKQSLYRKNRHSVDLSYNLVNTMRSFSIKDLPTVFRVSEQLGMINEFKDNLFPRTLHDIKKNEELFIGDDEVNIAWASIFFIENSSVIRDFVSMSEKLESDFLLNNYSDVENNLREIEEKTCQSIWLCDKKILLATERDGLKKQKELTAELKKLSSDFMSSFFHFISCKNEDKVTATWYLNTINKITNEFNDQYGSYLKLKFCGLDKLEKGVLSASSLDSNTSIIDYYESYIRSLQSYFSEYKNHNKFSDEIIKLIIKLSEKVDDYRLQNILTCLDRFNNEKIICRTDTDRLNIIESYVRSDFEVVNGKSQSYLKRNPFDIFICEIYAKTIIRTSSNHDFDGTLLGDIIDSLIELFNREEGFSRSISKINKICLKYSDFNFRYQLNYILTKELELIKGSITQNENISLLNQKYLCPRICTLTNKDYGLDILLSHFDDLGYKSSLYTYLSMHSNNIGELKNEVNHILPYRENTNLAFFNFKNNDYDNAKIHFENAYEYNDIITNNAITPYYIMTLIRTGEINKATTIIVDTYLNNPQLHIILPIRECCEELGYFDWPESIDIVILFYIYNEHISKDKVELMRYAFEYFISSKDLTYPSYLSLHENIEKRKIIFFFEKICTYEVMKRFPKFKSTIEIDKERISILNKLRDLNSSQSEKYINEIRDLTKSIVVKDGVKKAVQSKVYVDTENIRSSMKEEISEYFERYKALVKNEVLGSTVIDLYQLTRLLSEQSTTYNKDINNFINNTYADDNILATILRKVFYEFLKSEFGLNSFLSSRIRHGTLLNTLSKPLISEQLLTYMDNGNRKYSDKSNWFKRLDLSDVHIKNGIIDTVSILSLEFNDVVEKVKSKKIQMSVDQSISNSEKDHLEDALLNFSLTENDLVDIMSAISQKTTYDELMSILFEHFWQKVEHELANARYYIRHESNQEINKIFEKCLINIKQNYNTQHNIDLVDALNRARIGVNRSLSEIEGWLSRQESNEVNDFTLSIPVDIAVKMITGFDSNNQCTIIQHIDDSISIKGNFLIYFVDIFYPLIDNVIQRSGLPPEQRKINVLVEENVELEQLKIIVSNSVSYRDNIEELNNALSNKIKGHLADLSPQMLTQEGGSGFYKIIKTIKNSLKSSIYNINAEFVDCENFNFEVVIDCRRLKS